MLRNIEINHINIYFPQCQVECYEWYSNQRPGHLELNSVHNKETISNYQIVSTASDDILLTGPSRLELGALCGERQEQGHRQGGPGNHAYGDQDDHEIFLTRAFLCSPAARVTL